MGDRPRRARLRVLFDYYDVDKSGTLEGNELECILAELGRDVDHTSTAALMAEFGDVSRGDDGADGRVLSLEAFARLLIKLEGEAEDPRGEATDTPARRISGLLRRFSLSVVNTATGGDDETTRALPRQTPNDETPDTIGDAPPAPPRAPPAPDEEPAATNSIVDDDAGAIETNPTVVAHCPPLSSTTQRAPVASSEPATIQTADTLGDAPPAPPRAAPAPEEQTTATKGVIDDDEALAPPPLPAVVVPPPPPQPAPAPPARLVNGSGIRRSGDIANLFVVGRFLAKGGCGEVYLARQVETGDRYALKRVLVTSRGTARWEDELNHCAEANVMLQLSRHENVMTMQYCIVSASEFFMFFDLIDGARDVIEAIKSGELYKGESGDAVRARSLSILTQAAVAIAFVNEQGVLHEDVKHENGECVVSCERLRNARHDGPHDTSFRLCMLNLSRALAGGAPK